MRSGAVTSDHAVVPGASRGPTVTVALAVRQTVTPAFVILTNVRTLSHKWQLF
ncbi:hypothetical protein [Sphingomonas faeni]|uniref:hypothetical protein n=1 Tax=Sphingomonas faeni TaxID=185950 RepID=UPI0020C81878|nr:hypothetical protein [Sphingomonas faeni]MCP8889349.1 hypothetical protein [Sphingomonas faeni]